MGRIRFHRPVRLDLTRCTRFACGSDGACYLTLEGDWFWGPLHPDQPGPVPCTAISPLLAAYYLRSVGCYPVELEDYQAHVSHHVHQQPRNPHGVLPELLAFWEEPDDPSDTPLPRPEAAAPPAELPARQSEEQRDALWRECFAQFNLAVENRLTELTERVLPNLGELPTVAAGPPSPPSETEAANPVAAGGPPDKQLSETEAATQRDEIAIAEELGALGHHLEAAFVRHFKGRQSTTWLDLIEAVCPDEERDWATVKTWVNRVHNALLDLTPPCKLRFRTTKRGHLVIKYTPPE
jgi:hypothetical protein